MQLTEWKSVTIGEIATALCAAQSEMQGAAKVAENPHLKSKYADLASVWDACREPLTKNGLAVVQLPSADGPKVTVTTIMTHKSGEFFASELTMTAQQNTPQGIGSAITYGRRYTLSAMAGIAPEDDDGEAASGGRGTKEAAKEVAEKKLRKLKGEDEPPSNVSAMQQANDAAEKQSADKYKALAAFADLKKEIIQQSGSDALYYQWLGACGYEKSNQIPVDELRGVFRKVAKEFTNWKGAQPLPEIPVPFGGQ